MKKSHSCPYGLLAALLGAALLSPAALADPQNAPAGAPTAVKTAVTPAASQKAVAALPTTAASAAKTVVPAGSASGARHARRARRFWLGTDGNLRYSNYSLWRTQVTGDSLRIR